MSGGGGNTTTVQNADPWSGAQPYLRDVMARGQQWANNPAGFYPGPTYLGPTSGQLAGWDTQLNYADQVFGGAQAPRFGEATGALSGALTGQNALGSYAGGLTPFAQQQLMSGFGGAPNLQTVSGLDTTAAFQKALSGTPDYSGLQGSIDAANAPILRQLEQDIIPGLNQRATFLGNPTGGIKTLNRVLPEIGERMSMNAATLTEGERQRALGAQQQAAQYLTGAGMQGASDYRGQLLGLGQLGGSVAGAQSDAALRATGMFPSLVQTGSVPGQLSGQFADWGAGFQQQALQDQMDRFNYYQNLPLTSTQQYSGLVSGMGGLGGTQTMTGPGPNRTAGALGGALSGASMGSAFGPWGALIGAGIGAIGGYSDRRLKTDVVRVGALDSGLSVYRYRYKGESRYQIGVMADEAREKFPDAVTPDSDGFLMVNYSKVA